MPNFEQIHFQNLRSVIKEKTIPLIVWCGAGLSSSAGLPTWAELKNNMLDLYEKEIEPTNIDELTSIRHEPDLWTSFSRMKNMMQPTTFYAYIRKFLDQKKDVPDVYKKIWELGPRGIVTLNLDRFAAMSFNEVKPSMKILEFDGFEIKDNYRLLKGPDSFIVNMHGVLEKNHSWVFTREELSALQHKDGYTEFITTLFSAYINLFIGISADDLAAGGVLYNLVFEKYIDLGTHFWMTDRNDTETRQWAEVSGVGLIRYPKGNHSEICDYLDNIIQFLPKDEDALPVIMSDKQEKQGITGDLTGKSANELREILNGEAKNILSSKSDQYIKYFEFLDKYDEECHNAWYIGKTKEKKKIFNYQILNEIGAGSFGTVYKVEDENGNIFAMKVIHQEIRNQRDKLKCFRRGVRSLSILNEKKVPQIVSLYDTAEIPLLIIMKYVEGPNLKTFKEMNQCDDWETIIELFKQCSKILVAAHALPERVLHRDLRPTNIMLEDYYNCGNINVVLCDFDFSWHKDAIEDSINRSPNGYIAPEQIEKGTGYSTRSSLVDSFGLGMNMFYFISGNQPSYKVHMQKDWSEILKTSCEKIKKAEWICIPYRVYRLISKLTENNQNMRWDLSQANLELTRLQECLNTGTSRYSEILGEEMFARIVGVFEYDVEAFSFNYRFKNGLKFSLMYDEIRRTFLFEIAYNTLGTESYANILRYLPSKKEKANSIFTNNGWHIVSEQVTKGTMNVSYTISHDRISANMNEFSKSMKELKMEFNFT